MVTKPKFSRLRQADMILIAELSMGQESVKPEEIVRGYLKWNRDANRGYGGMAPPQIFKKKGCRSIHASDFGPRELENTF